MRPCSNVAAWARGWRARLLLQRLLQVLFLDFVASDTFCVPEDPASLPIDRLAGKWAIKNFSPACRSRPALELDTRGNFQNPRMAQISMRIEAVGLRLSSACNTTGTSTTQSRNCTSIDDSIDETLRETLLGNDLDHTGYFFHDLWFGDMDKLLQVR